MNWHLFDSIVVRSQKKFCSIWFVDFLENEADRTAVDLILICLLVNLFVPSEQRICFLSHSNMNWVWRLYKKSCIQSCKCKINEQTWIEPQRSRYHQLISLKKNWMFINDSMFIYFFIFSSQFRTHVTRKRRRNGNFTIKLLNDFVTMIVSHVIQHGTLDKKNFLKQQRFILWSNEIFYWYSLNLLLEIGSLIYKSKFISIWCDDRKRTLPVS